MLQKHIDSHAWRVAVIHPHTALTAMLQAALKQRYPTMVPIDCPGSVQDCLQQVAAEGAKQLTFIQVTQKISQNSMRFTRADLILKASHYAVCRQERLDSITTQGRILSPFGEEKLDWSVAAEKLLPRSIALKQYAAAQLSCH